MNGMRNHERDQLLSRTDFYPAKAQLMRSKSDPSSTRPANTNDGGKFIKSPGSTTTSLTSVDEEDLFSLSSDEEDEPVYPSKPSSSSPSARSIKTYPGVSTKTAQAVHHHRRRRRQTIAYHPPLPTIEENSISHRRIRSAPAKQELQHADLATLQDHLRQWREHYGPQHALVARTWNLIGNAHFRKQEYDLAIGAYREAVVCGSPKHLADAYSNLGTIYWTMNKVEEALDFLLKAKDVHKLNVLAAGHDPSLSLDIATVRYQIGLAYTLQGLYESAMRQFRASQRTRAQVLGPMHLDVARVSDAMGKLEMMRRHYKEALYCFEHALRIRRLVARTENDASLTLATLSSIAKVHQQRGDLDAALHAYNVALQTQKVVLRLRKTRGLCKMVGDTLMALSWIYHQKGCLDAAEASAAEASEYLQATAGD